MHKSFPVVLVATGLALALAGCGSTPAAPAATGDAPAKDATPISIKIGYTAIGAAYSDLYVCEDEGIFTKNGLDAELVFLNSSSQLVPALASGSVDVGAGVARTTAGGIMKGIDLRYIALPIPVYYMEMWGNDKIKSPEDMKGKKIGLSSPGSLGDASVDAWLKDMGWTDKDVQKTFLKSSTAEVTALKQGAVDAIVTQPPTGTQTREFGAVKVMDFTKYPAAANAYNVTAKYLAANKEAVTRFVKSETECLALLHKDKDKAVASIIKHTTNPNKALAEYSYDFFEPLWAKNPAVDPKLVSQAFDLAAALGDGTKPSDTSKYVDNSFVEKLDKAGYIDGLYK
jgi:NitT/TauT family transport system substrate-binding protein